MFPEVSGEAAASIYVACVLLQEINWQRSASELHQISKKRKFVAGGVFYAELNGFLMRTSFVQKRFNFPARWRRGAGAHRQAEPGHRRARCWLASTSRALTSPVVCTSARMFWMWVLAIRVSCLARPEMRPRIACSS